ncbi:MAG: class I SAM-dependent methyltransferase [Chloroflexota bacterium]|nr:class I SAM-dependent methyltransferase [Chloroflexota bacterium]
MGRTDDRDQRRSNLADAFGVGIGDGVGAFPSDAFDRPDPAADTLFYQSPRYVYHIDEGAIAAVTAAIRSHVLPGADVLDLMGSWVSHLPPDAALPLGRVVGHGLNADELVANARLDDWWVQDLNADPTLPQADGSFDAVLITVSIQYLTRPANVLREIARVLRPGGPLLVSFSNRMFGTKAVRIWQETPDGERANLVAAYLAEAGGFAEPAVEAHLPRQGLFGGGDPLWTVVTRRA